MSKIRVLIVDDHPIVREGLVRRINAEQDMQACGEAESAAEALEAAEKLQPDLIVVDLGLKDSNGLDLIKDLRIRQPKLPVLVLSMQDESFYAERALRAGARGYIMKQEAAENIIVAIRRVLEGQVYVSENLASRLLETMVTGKHWSEDGSIDLLSDRELEVFDLLGRGLATRQIAERLHVSVKTVETYREHIKDKLHIDNANELVHQAVLWVQKRAAP